MWVGGGGIVAKTTALVSSGAASPGSDSSRVPDRREKKLKQEFKNSWTPIGLTDVEREGMAVARVLEKGGAEHFDYTFQNNVVGRPRRGLTPEEEGCGDDADVAAKMHVAWPWDIEL